MTTNVRVKVPAKVNLALRVGQTDAEGYHELGTVFQAMSLWDEVRATRSRGGRFSLSFRGEGASFLPVDETNLALRAAHLLADEHDVTDGVELLIQKRIPVAGGMAGGSADAAATLVACNELWGLGLDLAELTRLGSQLGSDVAFMLLGGTAVGVGRGDILQPLPTRGEYHWTLALAHIGLSTAAVYREFDRLSAPRPVDVPAPLVDALAAGDVEGVGAAMMNDLGEAAVSLAPQLQATLDKGLEAGALGAVVSGSGPTCAFLTASAEGARQVAEALEDNSWVRAVRHAVGPVPGAHLVEE